MTAAKIDPIMYHMLPKDEWEKAQAAGSYSPESVEKEGFIHTSRMDQTVATANRYYGGKTDMVLLRIDRVTVKHEVKDDPVHGDTYAHIYGPLNLDAVTGCAPFLPNGEGVFGDFPTYQ
jgi:uncharacterized protein (DUF952 family)